MNLKFGLAIGTAAVLAVSLQASATPKYFKALKEAYPDSAPKCNTCHLKSSGGKELNPYGVKFKETPDYATDPVAALKKVGAP